MLKNRKSIRLDSSLYQMPSQPFSIVICTQNGLQIFKSNTYATLIFESILSGRLKTESDLMATCLMPDHLHLLISPIKENLIDVIGAWKSFSTNLLFKLGYEGRVWQRSLYDHALRKEEQMELVAKYIVNNPVRANIVEKWQDYKYSWHKWI